MRKYIIALGWGIILWLVGYLLGIVLFFILPTPFIGWVIFPIGILVTLWILVQKIHHESMQYYILLAFLWTSVAIIFDYFFLVKLLNPKDGYYKLDVYLYYIGTFIFPLAVGWWKNHLPVKRGGNV